MPTRRIPRREILREEIDKSIAEEEESVLRRWRRRNTRSGEPEGERAKEEGRGGRGTKEDARVFLESYNSTKHNPRVNLTSPGGAS